MMGFPAPYGTMRLTLRKAGEMKHQTLKLMPDDIPPAPSESADDASKAETIRITLPTKEQPTAKRETVRINLPGKPAPTGQITPGVVPKKETTKIVGAGDMTQAETQAAPPPPPASGAKPFVPPPPKPPSSLSSGPLKPVSGINPPPKPPSLGAKPGPPGLPAKPAPSAAAAAATLIAKPPAPGGGGTVEPVTQKAAAPKKETARITLPPEGGKPGMPKATIKMQQTQPLIRTPGATVTQSGVSPAPALATTTLAPAMAVSEPTSDGAVTVLSIFALVIALVSLALVFLAYNASSLS